MKLSYTTTPYNTKYFKIIEKNLEIGCSYDPEMNHIRCILKPKSRGFEGICLLTEEKDYIEISLKSSKIIVSSNEDINREINLLSEIKETLEKLKSKYIKQIKDYCEEIK